MALPISRQNPVITKLDSAEFKSIFTEELEKLVAIFKEYNYEIRIAGGAVRYLVKIFLFIYHMVLLLGIC